MSTADTIPVVRTPRLGFLGVGWIGRSRMQGLAGSGVGAVAAIADPMIERVREAGALVPEAMLCTSLDALLELELDGIVVATPSALHAVQCERALERGLAVFCQKPLARTAAETQRVIAAARAADRLLGIDLSYRHTTAMRAIREAVRSGEIGDVYAVDLVFHNAYGPDAGWARDPALAGGGCVIDLGVHLVDLAFWVLGQAQVTRTSSQLYARGRRLTAGTATVCEDHASAVIELASGTSIRLACSWESSNGRDAIIQCAFHGSSGGAAMRNVDGSFHDFVGELYCGASCTTLAAPPDDWGPRALVEWSRRLAHGAGYDPAVESMHAVAATLDAVLGR